MHVVFAWLPARSEAVPAKRYKQLRDFSKKISGYKINKK